MDLWDLGELEEVGELGDLRDLGTSVISGNLQSSGICESSWGLGNVWDL